MNKYISEETIKEFRSSFSIPKNIINEVIADFILEEISWRYASPEYFEKESVNDFIEEYKTT